MRAIVIGAGRGSRLQHETSEIPKTMVEVMGRPMLDWVLDALAEGGFQKKDVVFICGYAEAVVKSHYPELTFVRNTAWESNNILASLMYARDHLADGFVSTYADIVYEGAIVKKLASSPHSIALGCDTAWRRRYVGRSQHPETDAEKLRAEGTRVIELSRKIESEAAQGEFIGVMKLDREGASALITAYDRAKENHGGGVWREGRTFEKAYLIDLLEDMLEQGAVMHRENTNGGYMEIDTLEDLSMAAEWWQNRP
jgi:L-glutamine-phosphate cytidylyltransferase